MWYFEMHKWNSVIGGDAAETGSGPGSYDIRQSVWHVNCCNPEINGGGGWGVFNSILGWTNSATYGSVISYNLYWVAVIITFFCMRYFEKRGHWPLMKPKEKHLDSDNEKGRSDSSDQDEAVLGEKAATGNTPSSNVREINA